LGALTPYAHVADVQRSVDFYRLLGLELGNSYREDGRLVWAFVTSAAEEPNAARARLMLALADEPVVPSQQAVLFSSGAARAGSTRATRPSRFPGIFLEALPICICTISAGPAGGARSE